MESEKKLFWVGRCVGQHFSKLIFQKPELPNYLLNKEEGSDILIITWQMNSVFLHDDRIDDAQNLKMPNSHLLEVLKNIYHNSILTLTGYTGHSITLIWYDYKE